MAITKAKKVLIIAYYWPPAGGPGVQRWLKFVKYLPKFGVEPIVYVPSNPSYPIVDRSLEAEIPSNVTIIKKPISEPYKLAKLFSKGKSETISKGIIHKAKSQSLIEKVMLYIRGNYFIPDARKSWVKPSVSFLKNYILENKLETIITTGPPHSLHLIGLGLKRDTNVRWIADFRDPWTTIGYHKKLKLSEEAKQKHLQLEKEVLNSADQLIVTSRNTKNEFIAKTKVPIKIITNGYDSHSVSRPKKDSGFVMSHIGSLLSDRNPKLLWEILSELTNSDSEFAEAFKLNLVGVVSEDVVASLKKFNLKKYTEFVGYVSHQDALTHQMSSQILLLIEINSEDTKAIIPGKLFEYMQSGTPILAIGPNGSDIEGLIQETNTGNFYGYDEKEKLKRKILEYFETYKVGSITTNPRGITEYSRENLTKKLVELI